MSEYAKSHFHLRAEQEREKAASALHDWQRDQFLSMAALFERLSQEQGLSRIAWH